jgi:nucleotide-binding universal stress UspA family protein
MVPIKRIVFPADFSDRCHGAAHAVRALARRFGSEVTVLHVVESASPQVAAESLASEARSQLEKLIARDLNGCKVTPCVTTGDPAVRIIEHARAGHCDLIMMPTHGHGPFRRYLLGSVTAKVLHDARCPVWTSTHLENWPSVENVTLRNILCGVDFSPRSSAAFKCASQVAAEFQANLTVLHVIPLFGSREPSRECRDQAGREAEERVHRMTVELGVSERIEIQHGSPASALSDAADRLNADLMVIGRTHAATDVAKLGSNAYAIIAHAPCPVLSV